MHLFPTIITSHSPQVKAFSMARQLLVRCWLLAVSWGSHRCEGLPCGCSLRWNQVLSDKVGNFNVGHIAFRKYFVTGICLCWQTTYHQYFVNLNAGHLILDSEACHSWSQVNSLTNCEGHGFTCSAQVYEYLTYSFCFDYSEIDASVTDKDIQPLMIRVYSALDNTDMLYGWGVNKLSDHQSR